MDELSRIQRFGDFRFRMAQDGDKFRVSSVYVGHAERLDRYNPFDLWLGLYRSSDCQWFIQSCRASR